MFLFASVFVFLSLCLSFCVCRFVFAFVFVCLFLCSSVCVFVFVLRCVGLCYLGFSRVEFAVVFVFCYVCVFFFIGFEFEFGV